MCVRVLSRVDSLFETITCEFSRGRKVQLRSNLGEKEQHRHHHHRQKSTKSGSLLAVELKLEIHMLFWAFFYAEGSDVRTGSSAESS